MAAWRKDRAIVMAILGPGGSESAMAAVEGGADFIQIRARELSSRALAAFVRDVVAQLGGGERVIVNGRADIAESAGAGGVHLPESGADPQDVRRAFPGLWIGVSRHDRAGLERAAADGVDYALLGPVFTTPGKEDHALGLDRFAECVRGISLAVVAVGGIDPERARAVLGAGACGIAAIRPFAAPDRARDQARLFREALDSPGAPASRSL